MKYEINKPESELTEGYFNIVLKYFTLFIIGWIGGWMFLLFVSSSRRGRGAGPANVLFDNPEYTSIAIALALIFFFGQRTFKKYRQGLITSIEFDETKLKLGLLNTINGSHKDKEIDFDKLTISMQTKQDNLFGKQRLFEFYENKVFISRLNIEMTAWCRHPEIEILVKNLLDIKDKSNKSDQQKIDVKPRQTKNHY